MRQVGQLVVSNANLAQQLATGKAQLATINGQQVLIRTAQSGATVGSNMILKTQQPQTAVKVIKSPTTTSSAVAATSSGASGNQTTPTKGSPSPSKITSTPTKSTAVTNATITTTSTTNATSIMQVRSANFYFVKY